MPRPTTAPLAGWIVQVTDPATNTSYHLGVYKDELEAFSEADRINQGKTGNHAVVWPLHRP